MILSNLEEVERITLHDLMEMDLKSAAEGVKVAFSRRWSRIALLIVYGIKSRTPVIVNWDSNERVNNDRGF